MMDTNIQKRLAAFLLIPIFPWLLTPFSIAEYARELVLERFGKTSSVEEVVSTTTIDLSDKDSLVAFVEEQAVAHGVDPAMAVFIADKESRFREDVITGKVDGDTHLTCSRTGEPMRSRGLWQVNNCAHADVSDEIAYDVVSSTLWAMPKLLERPWLWSTYKLWLRATQIPYAEASVQNH